MPAPRIDRWAESPTVKSKTGQYHRTKLRKRARLRNDHIHRRPLMEWRHLRFDPLTFDTPDTVLIGRYLSAGDVDRADPFPMR
ncbi:hypothetical protein EVAR_82950_1 [Eumeta japonica]|uniref:Uncharacterized protein n=1 Tax=Eumeta variegata TaxID=151549 RepID=A0A4C1X0G2_EUMVA|nr:hypothetical protein EVAR_82950_1 [Eumeta japonica]